MGHERAERAEGYEDTMQVRGPADSLLTDTSNERFRSVAEKSRLPSSLEIQRSRTSPSLANVRVSSDDGRGKATESDRSRTERSRCPSRRFSDAGKVIESLYGILLLAPLVDLATRTDDTFRSLLLCVSLPLVLEQRERNTRSHLEARSRDPHVLRVQASNSSISVCP